MTHEAAILLAALQHADSFFPSGGIAFSWGVETLVHEGHMRGQHDLAHYVSAQLRLRWNAFDRPFLVAACRCARDLAALSELDCELDAMMLAREAREGSRRAGAALLLTHEKLGTAGVAAYRARISQGEAMGHLSVAQALVWTGVGMTEDAVQAVSAYIFCVSMVSAALRLGAVGHLSAQHILTHTRSTLAELLALPAETHRQAQSFAPAAEIAIMRHETQSSRLFAN